jgi:hypothetical protein
MGSFVKGRTRETGMGDLRSNILTFAGVKDGVFVFIPASSDGRDRIHLTFGRLDYRMCYMWIVVVVIYDVAPLAGKNDAAAMQLKVRRHSDSSLHSFFNTVSLPSF